MSGGAFEYKQYHIKQIAEEIQSELAGAYRKVMKHFFIILLFLGITSCEKESECCSHDYWTTYHNNTILNEECACCYDITGRIIECPK